MSTNSTVLLTQYLLQSYPAKTKMLSRRRKIGYIDVVSLLEMKVSPTLVDNVVAMLIDENNGDNRLTC